VAPGVRSTISSCGVVINPAPVGRGDSGDPGVAEDLEHGIPGHASKKEWANRLQRWLREHGFSFEAEGEAVRIHLPGGAYVEITEAQDGGEGFEVAITVPLAGTGEEAEEAAKAFQEAMTVAKGLGGELRYELDTSIPEYPSLKVARAFTDPEEMATRLMEALRPLAR